MGRNPKPTELLEYEKGKLYDRQRDRAKLEPKPKRGVSPRCPKRFGPNERKAWRDIATLLKEYGLCNAANAIGMELLATAWAEYIEVSAKLSEKPDIIIKGPNGGPMYNPYFNAQHKLGQIIDRYAQNLGLGSIALAKIGSVALNAQKQKSIMEELLD